MKPQLIKIDTVRKTQELALIGSICPSMESIIHNTCRGIYLQKKKNKRIMM